MCVWFYARNMRGKSEIEEEEKEEVNQVKKRRGEKSISKYACKLCELWGRWSRRRRRRRQWWWWKIWDDGNGGGGGGLYENKY